MTISPKITNPSKNALREWRRWLNRSRAGQHRLAPPRGREPVQVPLHLDGHLVKVVCAARCKEVLGHTIRDGTRLLVGFPYYEVDPGANDRFAFTCPACRNSYGVTEAHLATISDYALEDEKEHTIRAG